jgi:AcrR family transcriptional regulator
MSSAAARRAIERQKAGTRQAIVEAALTLMRERPGEPFSHESVAAGAAVSPRTVYRHFPTRRDLTEALWVRLRDETGTRWPQREAEIAASLRRTFRQFEEFASLTRAAIAAAASTEYPVHGSAEGRAAFQQSLSAILEALPAADGRALVAACVAIYSAPFWQMLRDRGQLPPRRAEDAAVMAMDAVITAARQRAAVATSPGSRSTR